MERSRGDRFVLKQAREQLRVEQEWKCDVRRIWREMDVLRICGEVLQKVGQASPPAIQVSVPDILFEDRDSFCYAMTAAPEGHRTWKEMLLAGEIDPEIAATAGGLLGALHAGTWQDKRIAELLGDRSYFEALRIEPYFRFLAERKARKHLYGLSGIISRLELHAWCLVHGDFSPKNLLSFERRLILIDFEVGHYGDPAFDVGFFLSHLILKAIRSENGWRDYMSLARIAWHSYRSQVAAKLRESDLAALETRARDILFGCMYARIEGKSPVDYLDTSKQERVRQLLHFASFIFGDMMETLESTAKWFRWTTVHELHAREVLDSRGKPTLEAEVWCDGKLTGTAIVPSGASTGSAEAHELRDGDANRYDGMGVRNAVAMINETISQSLAGLACTEQQAVDQRLLDLDPTPQKSRFGGNTLLAISLATAHAGANVRGIELWKHLHDCFLHEAESRGQATPEPRLPLPMVNMISGGKHAGGNLDFQDILIQPIGTSDYSIQLEWIVRVYRRLSKLLIDAGYEGYLVGDEGGFGPRLKSNREAVEFVVRAIEAAKLQPGSDVNIAIDVASSHFYRGGRYHLAAEQGKALTSSEMIDRLEQWVDAFPIVSIEDGLAEDDWEGWQELTKRLGCRIKLVGDDLFATNEARVKRGIELGCGNSVLVKVNQIGTLTETFRTMLTAMAAGYSRVVSARSGETEDTTIADLAVGVGAESIKIGSIVRSERLAKYNRLLRIAEQL